MVAAILVGVLAGVVGFAPYLIAGRLIRRSAKAGGAGQAITLIGAFVLSFAVLAIAVVICVNISRDMALPFALAEVGTLLVATAIFGLRRLLGRKKER